MANLYSLRTITILIISSFLLSSCTGYRYFLKKGRNYSEAGLDEQAVQYYYNALRKNPAKLKGRVEAEQIAQQALNKLLDDFYFAYGKEDYKEAVYLYVDAEHVIDLMQKVDVPLNYPKHYAGYFEESKAIYTGELLEEGQELMQSKRYVEAEQRFAEILDLVPENTEVAELKENAVLENLYHKALSYFEKGKYRQAYYAFEDLAHLDPNYKDTRQFQEQALKQSLFTVAINKVEDRTYHHNIAENLKAQIISRLSNTGDPFLKLVNKENYNLLVAEQQQGMTGLFDESTVAEAGKLLGVQALLDVVLLEVNLDEQPVKAYSQKGFEKRILKKKGPEGETKFETTYQPVYYYTHNGHSSAEVRFQVTLFSTETGEILLSEYLSLEDHDAVSYASYKGNHKNLYPSDRGNHVLTGSAYYDLQRKLNAKRNLTSLDKLLSSIYNKAGAEVTDEILVYHRNH